MNWAVQTGKISSIYLKKVWLIFIVVPCSLEKLLDIDDEEDNFEQDMRSAILASLEDVTTSMSI